MADVLIVCVREDEAQAKSLADMFERAGFSVGGAPSNDGVLRSCGATVVMWSQASIRSRPFLDASQRAVNAGKAILACLIDPPPGDSVGDSPAFDIADWDGDPEDPCLDPLFFAVDRLVAASRASAGGDAFDAPPARSDRAPPPARDKKSSAPRAPYEPPRQTAHEPAASYQTRSARSAPPAPRMEPLPVSRTPARQEAFEPRHDPLGSEAELWRQIRHSRNPADFLDYLSKYGPDGAFSELADLRLKELQNRQPAREAPPARTVKPAAEPRVERTERAEPQNHAFDPSPRLRAREPERSRARDIDNERDRPLPKALERDRERPPAHVRESGGGNGVARTLFAVVLLGGAALAGGLYFGLKQQAPSEVAEAGHTPPAPAAQTAPATTEDNSVSYDEAALDPPPQIDPSRNAPRGGPDLPREPTPRAAATPQARQTQQAQAATSDQQTRDLNGAALSGPVPLMSATAAPPTATPSAFVQPAPAVSVAATPAPQTVQAAHTIGRISWAAQPSPTRIAALYPNRAMQQGQDGSARLDCTVRPDFGLSCTIAAETPQGAGFGQAALRAAAFFRVNASLSNGDSAAGVHTNLTIHFQAP